MNNVAPSSDVDDLWALDFQSMTFHDRALELYRARNLHTPISRLPPEVLGQIFLINTQQSTKYEEHENDPGKTTRFTSQVCHHWRTVTLGHALLWSRVIDFSVTSSKWMEEVLRRSGALPIDVGDEETPVIPHGSCRLMEHASRMRSLFIELPRRPWGLFDEYWQKPMPMLEVFSLTAMSWSSGWVLNTATFKILPKTLFKGDAPRLRSFSIEGCTVDFTLPIFKRLTKLHGSNIDPSASPSVGKWLQILSEMPALQELKICSAIGMLFPRPLMQVSLNHLSALELRASISACGDLLHHLTTPPLSKYSLSCHGTWLGPDLTTVLGVIKRELSHWPHDITTRTTSTFVTLLRNKVWIRNEHGNGGADSPEFSLLLTWYPDEDFLPLLMPVISALEPNFFSKSHACNLDIYLPNMHSNPALQSVLRALFRSMPSLEALSMHGTTPLDVFPALGYGLGETTDPILPNLSELFFLRADFDDAPGSDCLTAFLNHRSYVGSEIKFIGLAQSKISTGRAARLRALGVQLVQF